MKDKEMSRLGYATWRCQYHNFLIRTFGTFGRADSFLGIYGARQLCFPNFCAAGMRLVMQSCRGVRPGSPGKREALPIPAPCGRVGLSKTWRQA